MIKTYLADIGPLLNQEIYDKYYAAVPDFRQKKADRIRNVLDKAQSIGAWTLLSMAREENGLSEEAVYNLSHSGKYVLCTVDTSSQREVKAGCDIEVMKKIRLKVAKRFFCEDEYEHIRQTENEQEQMELFYRYWVLKESFMKAVRRGMGLEMKAFEINFSDDGKPVLIKQPDEYTEKYYYKEYVTEEKDARIAVCSTDNRFAEQVAVKYL